MTTTEKTEQHNNNHLKFASEEQRIKALAGADVPRYQDGRPVLYLNSITPLTFDAYKRYCKEQRKMKRLSTLSVSQWPKRAKSDKRFMFGKTAADE